MPANRIFWPSSSSVGTSGSAGLGRIAIPAKDQGSICSKSASGSRSAGIPPTGAGPALRGTNELFHLHRHMVQIIPRYRIKHNNNQI